VSKEEALRLLALRFTPEAVARMQQLAAQNRQGKLSKDEEAELDAFCHMGTLLATAKLRAERFLKNHSN
jgi:hypothetical protein